MVVKTVLACGTALAVLVATGCGGSSSSGAQASSTPPAAAAASPTNTPEVNPAGDIPDNQAYVAFAPRTAGYSVKVPEGWSRTSAGGAVSFTDKLNTVRLQAVHAGSAPTVAGVRHAVVPQLARTEP